MNVDKRFLFEAEFQCVGRVIVRIRHDRRVPKTCGSLIKVETYRAIVEGPGLEVTCRHCKQKYVVTTDGALPLTENWE